jgi:hypothetical protein
MKLYQCAFDGVSTHSYPTPSGLETTTRSRHIVLGQQILLSTIHNMGLLLSTEEKRNLTTSNSNLGNTCEDTIPPSYRCFQVVFATLHSLSDYYGIQHSDFPPDFELQLLIDTALEGLQSCESRKRAQSNNDNPLAVHFNTAPCA